MRLKTHFDGAGHIWLLLYANRKSCMGFHVNVSDLTLSDLERSNQGHPQIKLNIFNFILSTVTQIALILGKRVP